MTLALGRVVANAPNPARVPAGLDQIDTRAAVLAHAEVHIAEQKEDRQPAGAKTACLPQRTVFVLVTTPLTFGEYLAAKLITLTVLSLVSPRLPMETVNWTPLLVLITLAAAAVAAGTYTFGRRDLDTK